MADDETLVSPIDGRTVLKGLTVKTIEPPPFLGRINRTPTELLRAESTSSPDGVSPVAPKSAVRESERVRVQRRASKQRVKKARAVFGSDNRQLYTPTNVFPNRAVCKLFVKYPLTPKKTVYTGTGSMIGSRHVLTAGHVLYNGSQGGWAHTIRVVPGMDGNAWWFGSELLTWPNIRRRSVTGWTEDGDIDYDYGLITLNTGFAVGSFGLLYASDDTLEDTTAYLIGYPDDKGSPSGRQQFGVPSGGGITDCDSTLVYYAIDASKGQSGAGVYRFWKGKRAIIAVHGGQYDDDENRGARITKKRYNMIRGWQNAD
jgi:V8-like Glu-specific endopeptidase